MILSCERENGERGTITKSADPMSTLGGGNSFASLVVALVHKEIGERWRYARQGVDLQYPCISTHNVRELISPSKYPASCLSRDKNNGQK
jgi:hypothetical protein